MNCPTCGQHVRRPKTDAENLRYKRVFMRAVRRACEFDEYLAANVAAARAGRPHDAEAVEVAKARAAA